MAAPASWKLTRGITKEWSGEERFDAHGFFDEGFPVFFTNRFKVFARFQDDSEQVRVAGRADSRDIMRKNEVHALLNGLGVGIGFIPGMIRGLSVAPRTLRNRLDDHGTDVFSAALFNEFLRVISIFRVRELDEVDGEKHSIKVKPPKRFEKNFRRVHTMARDADVVRVWSKNSA